VTDVNVTTYPLLAGDAKTVQSLKIHYAVESGEAKTFLQNKEIVEFDTPSPFHLSLTIGKKYRKDVVLPFPLNQDAARVKIARKSLWIEYTAPVSDVKTLSARPEYVLPINLSEE
jgi:hypothetical protein